VKSEYERSDKPKIQHRKEIKETPNWCVSPLDYRYYGGNEQFFKRLFPYVSQEAYISYLLRVEATLAKMLAKWGICSHQAANEVEKACERITAEEVLEEDQRVHHDVRALVNCIRKKVSPEASRCIHLFATSADITDTANALRFKELTRDVILPDLLELHHLLTKLATEYSDVVQIGRTHGKHAEPITFGYAMASYVSRLGSRIQGIAEAMNNLRGKFSGAVGAYNALSLFYPTDPAILEIEFLHELGLHPTDTNISTQIVEPEFLTDLVYAIISCFSVLGNLADDIRHLHRTEIAEVREKYDVNDIGSSTMPHKVNPKNFENVKSLWKAYMPRIITVLMDQISEHQRDLTNSASGRFVPELFTGFDYAVNRLKDALSNIYVDKQKMKENLTKSEGSIVAEPLYILLALNGFPDAYNYVRRLVARSEGSKQKLTGLIWRDKKIQPILKKLKPEQVQVLKDPSKYIGAAYQRTIATCENWELSMSVLAKRFNIPNASKIKP
jgi:adenylosuccinate lyase